MSCSQYWAAERRAAWSRSARDTVRAHVAAGGGLGACQHLRDAVVQQRPLLLALRPELVARRRIPKERQKSSVFMRQLMRRSVWLWIKPSNPASSLCRASSSGPKGLYWPPAPAWCSSPAFSAAYSAFKTSLFSQLSLMSCLSLALSPAMYSSEVSSKGFSSLSISASAP